MALPTTPASSWLQDMDLPSRLFGDSGFGTDYELYEEENDFVLTVELPGFDPADISVTWDNGTLNIGAEHADADRGRRRTYHRRFRFPKTIDDDEITASYNNGILEVRLPISAEAGLQGTEIPVEG